MNIKKIIQDEIGKILSEGFGSDEEYLRIIQGQRGFALGMAALYGDRMIARSIESPYFKTQEEVCRFYSTWDPSIATMEEEFLQEMQSKFVILGDPSEVCALNSPVMEDNYPLGAQNDLSAPFNQDDNTVDGIKSESSKYKLVWSNNEFAFFRDAAGNTYVLYVEEIDKSELEPYADRESTFDGNDEDGEPMVSYGDWEVDGEILSNYINDNAGSLRIGKGLDDYENGGYHLVLLDDGLKAELMETARYIKDESDRINFIKVLSGQM